MEGRRDKHARHRPQESSQQREDAYTGIQKHGREMRDSALKGKKC